MKETTANKTYTLTSLSTQEADILTALSRHPFNNQRELATFTGHALGVVNKSVRNLIVETAVLGTHVVGDFGTGTSADTSVRPKLYKHMY